MISIVVPCYNCEKTLVRCVDSLRRQTYENIEIVLVDDGSSDSTYKLCTVLAADDSRLRVFHQENHGLMNAWKNGVRNSTGKYVTFCDSDDYVDENLILRLVEIIKTYHVDIVAYGMKVIYEDGTVVYRDNRLEGGYYTQTDIKEKVLPDYFSNGEMESHILLPSRCAKLFRRELLVKNFNNLNDEVTNGEDILTSFATALSADSLYCIKGFYPYNYMRNSDSMIGEYDALRFQKDLILREYIYKIATAYHYPYDNQIEDFFLSGVLLSVKKEVCRNRNAGYKIVYGRLREIRCNTAVCSAIRNCSVKNYNIKSKVFAYLFITKSYLALYILVRIMDRLGYGRE